MVKLIDKKKLNTNELRDFLAEVKIVGDKINVVKVPLQVIYTQNTRQFSKEDAQVFTTEGEVGVIVRNLEELRDNLESLRKRANKVKKTLLNSLTDFKKG